MVCCKPELGWLFSERCIATLPFYHVRHRKHSRDGSGSWATAIAKMLLEKVEHLHWYMRRQDAIDDFRRLEHNPSYLTSVHFDVDRITFSTDINEVVRTCNTLCLSRPRLIWKITEKVKGKTARQTDYYSYQGHCARRKFGLFRVLPSVYNVPDENLAVFGRPQSCRRSGFGPTHLPTVGCADKEKAQAFADIMASSYVKPKHRATSLALNTLRCWKMSMP